MSGGQPLPSEIVTGRFTINFNCAGAHVRICVAGSMKILRASVSPWWGLNV